MEIVFSASVSESTTCSQLKLIEAQNACIGKQMNGMIVQQSLWDFQTQYKYWQKKLWPNTPCNQK